MFVKLAMAVTILPIFLRASTIGVMVQGISVSATLGSFQDASNLASGLCASFAPDYPCDGSNQDGVNPTVNGFNTASVVAPTSATSGTDAVTPSSASSSASVSTTQGHVGMSFSAAATGLGIGVASGTATWNDTLTVGGLARGTPVTLRASLLLDVSFTGERLQWRPAKHLFRQFAIIPALFDIQRRPYQRQHHTTCFTDQTIHCPFRRHHRLGRAGGWIDLCRQLRK